MSSTTVTHPHDQRVVVSPQDMVILSTVDQVVKDALAEHDPRPALNFARRLRTSGQMTGVALAKLIFMLRELWGKPESQGGFGLDPDDFEDAAAGDLGVSPQTVTKYANAWQEVLSRHPKLMGIPMESLLLLTAAAREGQLKAEHWKELEKAYDKQAVRQIVEKVRGVRTSGAHALHILIDRDGTLRARRGSGAYHTLGRLLVESDDEVVQHAIERLLNSAGVARMK